MTATTTPRHQVATATAHLRATVDGVIDASVWSMTAPEIADQHEADLPDHPRRLPPTDLAQQ